MNFLALVLLKAHFWLIGLPYAGFGHLWILKIDFNKKEPCNGASKLNFINKSTSGVNFQTLRTAGSLYPVKILVLKYNLHFIRVLTFLSSYSNAFQEATEPVIQRN